jgi:hypothetical protein
LEEETMAWALDKIYNAPRRPALVYVDLRLSRADGELPVQVALRRDGDRMRIQACTDTRFGCQVALTADEEIAAIAAAWREESGSCRT